MTTPPDKPIGNPLGGRLRGLRDRLEGTHPTRGTRVRPIKASTAGSPKIWQGSSIRIRGTGRPVGERTEYPHPRMVVIAERYIDKMDSAFRNRTGRHAVTNETAEGRRRRINRTSHDLADAPQDVIDSILHDDSPTLQAKAREEGQSDGPKYRQYH